MRFILALLLRLLTSRLRSNANLEIELLVARQQLAIYQRSVRRPRLRLRDRLFWCGLSRFWSRWKDVLVIVKPATVIAWRRRKFRAYWARLSGRRDPGRPQVAKEIHLQRVLTSYLAYYHGARCHMSLDGDPPEPREPQGAELGNVVAIPEVGGLHHRYVRRAA